MDCPPLIESITKEITNLKIANGQLQKSRPTIGALRRQGAEMCGPADGLEQRTADEFERAWDESDDTTEDDCSVEFEQGEEV